jgi:hypothetical protein
MRRISIAAASPGAVLVAVLLVGFEPAAPEVDSRTLLIDEVRRGSFEMVVRGPGTLVPERIRWITGGAVRVGWDRKGDALLVWVEDEGPGLGDGQNLFVPFFTTKSDGSGIGLALSRQIAEGHGGELSLRNREGGRGCRAELRLPLR